MSNDCQELNVFQANFVDPQDRNLRTQGIERAWARAKLDLMRLKRGTSPALLPSHLARMWWESLPETKARPFLELLRLIRERYPQ